MEIIRQIHDFNRVRGWAPSELLLGRDVLRVLKHKSQDGAFAGLRIVALPDTHDPEEIVLV